MTQHGCSLDLLDGNTVVSWRGQEMALKWKEEEASGFVPECVEWARENVPFLQLTCLDALLDDGTAIRVVSQSDDGTGYFGLYVLDAVHPEPPQTTPDPTNVFRYRELGELPVGPARVVQVDRRGPHAVLGAAIAIGSYQVTLLAAEVHEAVDGSLQIIAPDESILVQVNGQRPEQMLRPNNSSKPTPLRGAA